MRLLLAPPPWIDKTDQPYYQRRKGRKPELQTVKQETKTRRVAPTDQAVMEKLGGNAGKKHQRGTSEGKRCQPGN